MSLIYATEQKTFCFHSDTLKSHCIPLKVSVITVSKEIPLLSEFDEQILLFQASLPRIYLAHSPKSCLNFIFSGRTSQALPFRSSSVFIAATFSEQLLTTPLTCLLPTSLGVHGIKSKVPRNMPGIVVVACSPRDKRWVLYSKNFPKGKIYSLNQNLQEGNLGVATALAESQIAHHPQLQTTFLSASLVSPFLSSSDATGPQLLSLCVNTPQSDCD